ncbi:MAG TPA: SIR2 family protein [Candidatus Binatia bacterium]
MSPVKANAASLRRLREAFHQNAMTLYIGAGCSVASNIPSWDRLVTELYMNGIARHTSRFFSVPALVPAVAQWSFARQVIPLEVAARKLRGYYQNDSEVLLLMKTMLYGLTGYDGRDSLRPEEIQQLLASNSTLRAVSSLCRSTVPGQRGVRSVISYNYDDFLEKSLARYRHQSVWSPVALQQNVLPIFHVHGYVPAGNRRGSTLDKIVLTEDQYNRVAQDLYSWQNLVQIHCLSSSVGLMIGLSLTDRNLRRILDALRNLPQGVEIYALLQYPKPWKLDDHDVDVILGKMRERILNRMEVGYGSNPMPELEKPGVRAKIVDAIRAMEKQDLKREELMLNKLGVKVLWYEEHPEVEKLIGQILPKSEKEPAVERRSARKTARPN